MDQALKVSDLKLKIRQKLIWLLVYDSYYSFGPWTWLSQLKISSYKEIS